MSAFQNATRGLVLVWKMQPSEDSCLTCRHVCLNLFAHVWGERQRCFCTQGSQGVCLSFPSSQRVLRRKNALFSWVPLNYSITKHVLLLHFRSLLGFQSENYFNPNQNILVLRTHILSYIYIKIKEKGFWAMPGCVCAIFFSFGDGVLAMLPRLFLNSQVWWSSCLKFQSSWDFRCSPHVCLYLGFCIGSIKVRPPEGSSPQDDIFFQGMCILC